jgi:hypothetical protein
MAYNQIQQGSSGSFVPTTQIYDVAELEKLDIHELLVRLYQSINSISVVLNTKETGFYLKEEFVNGALYFSPTSYSFDALRPEYTKVINFGAVGAGANPPVAHGLTIGATWSFTEIKAVCTNPTTGNVYPLPWAGAAGYIDIHLTAANVVINNTSGLTFPTCLVVLKYLKN